MTGVPAGLTDPLFRALGHIPALRALEARLLPMLGSERPIGVLRIVRCETSGEKATLSLEGRIVGPWVDQLRRSCEEVLVTGAALTLDLAEVDFVEQNGARFLRKLIGSGVTLVNCPAFVSEQLKALPPF